jgi:hypothetical protein
MTTATTVSASETPEAAMMRLRQYVDMQRDKLTAMGLPLATVAPPTPALPTPLPAAPAEPAPAAPTPPASP